MDYLTKPTNRETLRSLSVLFRGLFGVNEEDKFPVLYALERIGLVFKGTNVVIVDDKDLPNNIPARCYPDENGNFTIEIKESVYLGAMNKEIGAYNGFICHEMCHIFLYKIGFTPIFNRQFSNNKIPAYCSVEWQTKALCGEVMMPYYKTLISL
jgi:hypothetical protein